MHTDPCEVFRILSILSYSFEYILISFSIIFFSLLSLMLTLSATVCTLCAVSNRISIEVQLIL